MARCGGKRPGAGRPRGSANKKTREIANRVAETGKTPLEVMVELMAERREAGDWAGCLDAARSAAPYIHPKLSAIENKHTGDLTVAPRQLATSDLVRALGLDGMTAEQRVEVAAALGISGAAAVLN